MPSRPSPTVQRRPVRRPVDLGPPAPGPRSPFAGRRHRNRPPVAPPAADPPPALEPDAAEPHPAPRQLPADARGNEKQINELVKGALDGTDTRGQQQQQHQVEALPSLTRDEILASMKVLRPRIKDCY